MRRGPRLLRSSFPFASSRHSLNGRRDSGADHSLPQTRTCFAPTRSSVAGFVIRRSARSQTRERRPRPDYLHFGRRPIWARVGTRRGSRPPGAGRALPLRLPRPAFAAGRRDPTAGPERITTARPCSPKEMEQRTGRALVHGKKAGAAFVMGRASPKLPAALTAVRLDARLDAAQRGNRGASRVSDVARHRHAPMPSASVAMEPSRNASRARDRSGGW